MRVEQGTRPTNSGDTVEQLRRDIDHGRTGDKVAASDPAAAPLGADDEAAGTPISPHVVAATRKAEDRGMARPPRSGWDLGAAWILVGFVLVCSLGLVMWMLWR